MNTRSTLQCWPEHRDRHRDERRAEHEKGRLIVYPRLPLQLHEKKTEEGFSTDGGCPCRARRWPSTRATERRLSRSSSSSTSRCRRSTVSRRCLRSRRRAHRRSGRADLVGGAGKPAAAIRGGAPATCSRPSRRTGSWSPARGRTRGGGSVRPGCTAPARSGPRGGHRDWACRRRWPTCSAPASSRSCSCWTSTLAG